MKFSMAITEPIISTTGITNTNIINILRFHNIVCAIISKQKKTITLNVP